MPLLDLHAHFPMHLDFPPRVTQAPPPVDKQAEFWAANMLLNFQGGKPRVSLDELLAGASGGIGSVLYDPDDEFFRDAKPVPQAFKDLLAQMNQTEDAVKGKLKIATNPADVSKYLSSGEKFLFQCVEGAFAFGGDETNVDALASKGVAYVIVAHLFYRGVATCENAIPFVPDQFFHSVLNPEQNSAVGLTDLGRKIVSRLLQKKILVDITHCTQLAQKEIFQLARDHNNAPVISSHTGVRGTSDYPLNLTPGAIRDIAKSKGVIGVILASHWLRPPSQQIVGPDGFELIFRAIDHIHDVTESYDNIAIGSDLDGFIQPVKGCETYGKTPKLVDAIKRRYSQSRYPGVADKILYHNALDVLQRGWAGV
jgi:microsomal dipeptidase-like Zn-dependent dipeptidase